MEHAHHMAIPMFARVHQVSQELTVSVSTPASLYRAHKTFFTIIGFMSRYVSKMFSSYQLDKFIQIYSSLRLHLHYTGYSLKKCCYLTMNTCSNCKEECHRNLFNMCWYNFKTGTAQQEFFASFTEISPKSPFLPVNKLLYQVVFFLEHELSMDRHFLAS